MPAKKPSGKKGSPKAAPKKLTPRRRAGRGPSVGAGGGPAEDVVVLRRVARPSESEFGGNLACFTWIVGLPLFVTYFYGAIVMHHGELVVPDEAFWRRLVFELPDGLAFRPTWEGVRLNAMWLALQLALQLFVPGKEAWGIVLRNGRRLKYQLNGWWSFVLTFVVAFGLIGAGWLDPTVGLKQFGACYAVALLVVFAMTLYVYVDFGLGWRRWRESPEFEPDWGVFTVRDFFKDLWLGTARNPRLFHGILREPLDLKLFWEERPALILWQLINFSIAAAQYYNCRAEDGSIVCDEQGSWQGVTWAMLAIAVTHFSYICDHFMRQDAILTTTDIAHDQFGFMLIYGLYGFVPWYNTLYALFLFFQPKHEEIVALSVIGCIIQIFVQWLFNLAITQKHNFREYHRIHGTAEGFKIWGKQVEYLKTPTGSVLLCSGIWGMARHFNFVSDCIMCLGWLVICCGQPTTPWMPIFYPAWFYPYMAHRWWRDDIRCRAKYEGVWAEYCRKVPYKILPGIF